MPLLHAALIIAAVLSAPLALRAQSDPSQIGQWTAVKNWPYRPIHAIVLPNGKVMFFSYYLEAVTPYLWDPATDTLKPSAPMDYSLFCAGHALLADGRLLMVSGHIADNVGYPYAALYDWKTDTWTRTPDIGLGRWYPTVTTLGNGDALVVAGDVNPTYHNPLPQVWQRATNTWRDLTTAQLGLAMYSRMFLLPNGKIFQANPSPATRYIDPAGTGKWTFVGNANYGTRDYGPAILYDDWKVVMFGGGQPPTATAEWIDMSEATPTWRYTTGSMSIARRHHNATVLPDGTVFISGGSYGTPFDDQTKPVYTTEMYDPSTQSFTPMATAASIYRGYHSNAFLIPDGRVVMGGGNFGGPNVQIYSPPYLFKGDRPTIASAPQSITYGQSFNVATPNAADIQKVTWIRLPSVTHAFDMNQRINSLAFTASEGSLTVTAPVNPNACPPGHYMLFLLNSAGVPSVASIIQIDHPVASLGTDGELGTPDAVGSTVLNSGVYTVTGSGAGLTGNADQSHFSYWQMTGDGTLTARLVSPAAGQAGLLLRETLQTGSAYAFINANASQTQFDTRVGTGATMTPGTPVNTATPLWMRLDRGGDTISAFTSPDGITWTPLGSPTAVPMAATIYAGFAVNSGGSGSSSATFDNLTLTAASAPAADFTLTASPSTFSTPAGQDAVYTVSTVGLNAFNGSVTLSAVGLPAGVTAKFATPVVTGSGSSYLRVITTATSSLGTFPFTVSATSGSLTKTIPLSLTVTAPLPVFGPGTGADVVKLWLG